MPKYFKFVKNETDGIGDCRQCCFLNKWDNFCSKIGCYRNANKNNLHHKYAVKITKSEADRLIKSGCKIIYRGNNNG